MWIDDELITIASDALAAAEDALRAEQAVYGLDALTELELHPILADAFHRAGFGVLREQPYPGAPKRLPRHHERERCDLVLLPAHDASLADPVAIERESLSLQATLFAGMPTPAASNAIDPADAYWLELKTLGQFTFTQGIPGPNSAYAANLRTALDDLSKLAADPCLRRAGLLLILFGADAPTAAHDLRILTERAIARDLPVSSPTIRTLELQDRIGNAVCALALFPARCTKWIAGHAT